MYAPTPSPPPGQSTPWSWERLEQRRAASRQKSYQPLAPAAVAVVAGIVVDRYTSLGDLAALLAVASLIGWWWLWRKSRLTSASVALLATVVLTASVAHHAHWRLFESTDLGLFAARRPAPVCVEVIAVGSPSRQAPSPPSPYRAIPQVESSRLLVEAARLRDGRSWQAVEGRLELVVDGHLVGVEAGDRLRVFGQLAALPPATNPGQFDSALHHRSDRRLCRVRSESPDCVRVVKRASWPSPRRAIDRVRQSAIATLDRQLPPGEASLMAAMLLGERRRVTPETLERFRRTGAMHVLVVSGLHVGLVLAGFYFVTRMGWLPRRSGILAMMLLALAYGALAGGRPPVLRAVVLAEVFCVAALLGRRVLAFNSLAAAAIVVLAINPSELFRSGTQLSFLATATLIWFGSRELERQKTDPLDRLIASVQPWWRRGLTGFGRWGGLVIAATLAVWLVSAPLLLHRFHLLSPIAVPMSLAIFPLVSLAVTSGLALVLVSAVAPWLAGPFAATAEWSVAALDTLLTAADRLPAASLWLPSPTWWWTVGTYGLLAVGLAVRRFPTPRWVVVRLGILWLLVAVTPIVPMLMGRDEFRATVIDVGHGASVLVEAPGGGTLLYDAGSLGSPDVAAEIISGVLWSRGRTRIDTVVLSHADVDHFNAVPGLLDRFRIGGVYVSPMMLPPLPLDDDNRSAPAELRRLLTRRGIPVRELKMGDRLQMGAATVEVLHPTRLGVIGSDNANSLVLGVEALGRKLLLPGDLEKGGLELLLEQEPYDCDLLLAPHHGSTRSDPPGLARWCTPEWVVISGGAASEDAGASYATAGARVLRTSRQGAIRVQLTRDGQMTAQPLTGVVSPVGSSN